MENSLLSGHAVSRAMVATVAAIAAGCVSEPYLPHPERASPDRPPAEITTGTRIPRGTNHEVQDTSQNVDVYTEEELEAERPLNTRDAVNRALRGR
ncbi:MAG: hypothetical protein AAF610_03965 [Pseudomonadota bacterium]